MACTSNCTRLVEDKGAFPVDNEVRVVTPARRFFRPGQADV